jgi:hypothetical protein
MRLNLWGMYGWLGYGWFRGPSHIAYTFEWVAWWEPPYSWPNWEGAKQSSLIYNIKWQLVWAWSLCHYYLGCQSMFVVLKLMSGLFCEGNVENLHALWDGRGWSATTGIDHHPHFVIFVTIFDRIKNSIFPRCAAATLSLNKCFPWSEGGQLKALTTWTWLIWYAGFLFSCMHVGDNCNIYCEVM